MAKTMNKDIDIFATLRRAMGAFNRSEVPCQLLRAYMGIHKNYYVDKSKTAIKEWPNLYTLIKEK